MFTLLFVLLCHAFLSRAAILHCDFETDCNDFVFDYNWGLTDGNHSQGINHDHTFNTSAGHYRYYNPQDTSRFREAQIATQNWLEPSTDRSLCFRMWYYTPRVSMPFSIQVGQGDDERLALVLLAVQGKDPSTNDWALINVTLPNEKLKIYIRLNVSARPLVLDDFSVDYCDGSPPVPPKVFYSCDFESSCTDDFLSLSTYPYLWSIVNASDAAKIASGAPTADYTFGNQSGHYAFVPNAKTYELGKVGYLHLQREIQLTSKDSHCLSFQYYGFGGSYGISHLEVYAWTSDELQTVQMLWPMSGPDQYPYTSGRWTWGITHLPIGNYTLLFRMTSTDVSIRTFALDNIAINSCDYPPFELSPFSSLLSFSCNFDHSSMCKMINTNTSSTSAFNFTVFTAETLPDKSLGPPADHTSNSTSGGFLYWDHHYPFTGQDSGRVYTSKRIQRNTGMCIKMAYYVKSKAVNRNATTIRISIGGCEGGLLWSLSLDDSQGWQTVIVPSPGHVCASTFYFDASLTDAITVSVAFDDIEIDQCSSLIPTTTTSTTTTTAATTTTTTTTVTTTEMTTEISTSSSTLPITTSPTATTTSPTATTPSGAQRLVSLSGYSLISLYCFSAFFRKNIF